MEALRGEGMCPELQLTQDDVKFKNTFPEDVPVPGGVPGVAGIKALKE